MQTPATAASTVNDVDLVVITARTGVPFIGSA